jgi:electron transport complex protein RnfC
VPGPAATYDLGKLHGGLRLDANKTQSTGLPIQSPPLPTQLILPLDQHAGEPAQPLVATGERVLRGQLLAESPGTLGAPVHASSSGTVAAIEPWPVSGRRGDPAPCIVIECDGEDRAVDTREGRTHYSKLSGDTLLEEILQGGIVGLGGAVYPTAQKLMQAVSSDLEYLILNGAECEPYISCDDMLMRERAHDIVSGAQILLHALQLDCGYIVVESDKPEAIRQLADAMTEAGDTRLVLKQIPTIYPSGGEDQLVQLVTNREVPSGGLPTDAGCLVQNVGTAAAIHDWLQDGEPLVSRITTITGDGIVNPMNVRARIGTPVAELVAFAGGYTPNARHLVIGGPMTGRAVSTDRVPLVKASNCILVMSELPAGGAELPCIRCGECAAVCPVQLMPQQLFWYACADDEKQLREYGLTDCIECGCCDLVCPSHIPLTYDFRTAKARIRELADEKARAERARRRFEARTERLQRERGEREAELARQKDTARKAGPEAIAEILRRKQRDGED